MCCISKREFFLKLENTQNKKHELNKKEERNKLKKTLNMYFKVVFFNKNKRHLQYPCYLKCRIYLNEREKQNASAVDLNPALGKGKDKIWKTNTKYKNQILYPQMLWGV